MGEEIEITVVKCFFDPKTRTLRCVLSDSEWKKMEDHGGLRGVHIVHESEEKPKNRGGE